ncbi:hypothetical protein A0256_15695 [Mucilaginibacter sp. PAMC 26640]|nr:hypothetical protein A0256_15695 [Mucilaginibacter sp. PAMC 26640]
MIAGGLFINLPLLFISAPGIIISANFVNEKQKAFAACFLTPLFILLVILTGLTGLQKGDMEAYAITALSFMLVLAYFFYKNLTPNNVNEAFED